MSHAPGQLLVAQFDLQILLDVDRYVGVPFVEAVQPRRRHDCTGRSSRLLRSHCQFSRRFQLRGQPIDGDVVPPLVVSLKFGDAGLDDFNCFQACGVVAIRFITSVRIRLASALPLEKTLSKKFVPLICQRAWAASTSSSSPSTTP